MAVAKVASVRGSRKGQTEKVHAGKYIHDEVYEGGRHDLTEWVETPASSRVQAFRYDHMNRALQVTWRNNTNHGYIYLEVPYESYRSFARVASKGKYVNSTLNGFDYRLMDPDEVQAASNPERPGITSRVRY
jgi:hypothetical protein